MNFLSPSAVRWSRYRCGRMGFDDSKVFFDGLWWSKSLLWCAVMIKKSSLMYFDDPRFFFDGLWWSKSLLCRTLMIQKSSLMDFEWSKSLLWQTLMTQKSSLTDFDDPKVFFYGLWWSKSILWWTLMIQKSSLKKLGKQQFKYQIFKTNTDLTNQKKGHLVLVSRSQRKLFVCGVKVNKAWVRIDILVLVSKRTHSLSRPSHNNYLNTRVLLFYQHQRQHQKYQTPTPTPTNTNIINNTNTDTKSKTMTNINININMINFSTPLKSVGNCYKDLM